MKQWYYARGGQQVGPVSQEQLVALVRSGQVAPNDLVWNASMKDWMPAAQVPELFPSATSEMASANNPYSTPAAAWNPAPEANVAIEVPEIAPGSEPIDVFACIKRGFTLTTRHFGMILLVGVVYIAIVMAMNMVTNVIHAAAGITPYQPMTHTPGEQVEWHVGNAYGHYYSSMTPVQIGVVVITAIASQVVSLFLSIGMTRIGLNIVSGKPFEVGMLFGGGQLLLRAWGATILFMLMVWFGLLLLIVPGIYLAIRYGQYLHAMVDRNLSISESFRYSSTLTTNNRWALFGMAILLFLITAAGLLACCVGLIFTLPLSWLAGLTAYRWMQYGSRAAMDHPGTDRPMLLPM